MKPMLRLRKWRVCDKGGGPGPHSFATHSLAFFFYDCGSDFCLLPLKAIELPAREAITPGIRFVRSLRGSTSPQVERASRKPLKPPLQHIGFRCGGRSDSQHGRWAPKRARRTEPLQRSRGERRRGGICRKIREGETPGAKRPDVRTADRRSCRTRPRSRPPSSPEYPPH
jgi:hypothetical protein